MREGAQPSFALHGKPGTPQRGETVLCIPLLSAEDAVAARALIDRTEPDLHVLLAVPPACLEAAREALATCTRGVRGVAAGAGGHTFSDLAAAGAPADVLLATPGLLVAEGWAERLRAAALADSTFAAATPLSIGPAGVRLEVPSRQSGTGLEAMARTVASRSRMLRPRIATVGPGCAYLRRRALDLAEPTLAGSLSTALSGFAKDAIAHGMLCVLADDVLVGGGADAWLVGEDGREEPADPVAATLARDEHGVARWAVMLARSAVEGVSVTIDGRSLFAATGGTQTYVLDLVLALARTESIAVRVLVPPDLSEHAAAAMSAEGVATITYEEALERPPPSSLVHRPQQVFTLDDLALLRPLGERLLVGHQDLIAYHNPSYHADLDAWRAYRRTTRLALAGVDGALFFSAHARDDALAEGLLGAERAHVLGVGSEALAAEPAQGERPGAVGATERFLLCLGADYAHKNRPFAIALLRELRELGWDGALVFAGTHVPHGSSAERERQLLDADPELARSVIELGPVADAERRWLYSSAAAILYPTVYEGYGLVPLEAARIGTPCLFAAQASLAELSGPAATLVPWDAAESARAVVGLLSEGPAREHHLRVLRSLRIPAWSEVGEDLLTIYRRILEAPPAEGGPSLEQERDRERYVERLERDGDTERLTALAQEYQDAYHALERRVGAGLPLIGEGGLLSGAQQRGLMRLASRRVGRALIAPLGVFGGERAKRSSGG